MSIFFQSHQPGIGKNKELNYFFAIDGVYLIILFYNIVAE